MKEYIDEYIKKLNHLYQAGKGGTTEHSFRADFRDLIEKCTGLTAVNEKQHIDCGAPDYTLQKNDGIPVAYIETKNLEDGDLDGRRKNKKQFDRYKAALDTIVFTDYLDFHLYKEELPIQKVELAYIDRGKIILNEEAVGKFESLMEKLRFAAPQKITQPKKLAKLMAAKAKLISDEILDNLKNDKENKGALHMQLDSFRKTINQSLKENEFADLYAQTIAYGLFAARIHDNIPGPFNRIKAAQLIPLTNPFLRGIFIQLAGIDIEESIRWIVDDLVTIFAAVDVDKLRKNITKEMQKRDPMIHFYEEFLEHYNPEAKKKYGVYYTPPAVVDFIVRAVDDILKSEFGLEKGLADTSKVEVPIKKFNKNDDAYYIENEPRHRVQILDPATGTGTFLAEVVSRIKEQQERGFWSSYVDEDLIPRIYGFEYMMAPYTIAHLKLDMLVNWWDGEKLGTEHKERFQIYLTNSLTQTDLVNRQSSIAQMLAREANDANEIKHNARVMVVVGNPPYSGESTNKSEWIMKLMEDYKKEPNSEKKLNERNPKWINNDYCKFIRMAQDYVDRAQEGVVAYICANSFLDNPTFRGMRWNLLRSFDKIYIINLHGDSNKKEKCPDGSKDDNVFDIMTGTSINIFIKTGVKNNDRLAEVYYVEKYGLRRDKFQFLQVNNISNLPFERVMLCPPLYLFLPQDSYGREEYNKGFGVTEIFTMNSVGMVSANDDLNFSFSEEEQVEKIEELLTISESDWRRKYNREKDSRDWGYRLALNDAKKNKGKVIKSAYKPFDNRYTYFTGTTKGLYSFPRMEIMHNLIDCKNIALIASRQCVSDWRYVFATEYAANLNLTGSAGRLGSGYVFPLYIHHGSFFGKEIPISPNLNETIWRTIENWVNYGQAYKPLTTNEQNGELGFDAAPEEPHTLSPEDLFDYIYGVLHSPHYREKFKEFLKVDFPRIPYPKNKAEFEHYKDCGHQLRELHLMHNVPESEVSFPQEGSMVVETIRPIENIDDGYSYSVYINDNQFFSPVPVEAWNMYIGGYQPAQKWLKDRKGRKLSPKDIQHYKNIIAVLMETNRIMQQIDNPVEEVAELKHKVQELEHQLQVKKHSDIHYHINAENISLQTDGTINIGEINEK